MTTYFVKFIVFLFARKIKENQTRTYTLVRTLSHGFGRENNHFLENNKCSAIYFPALFSPSCTVRFIFALLENIDKLNSFNVYVPGSIMYVYILNSDFNIVTRNCIIKNSSNIYANRFGFSGKRRFIIPNPIVQEFVYRRI